MSNSMIRVGSPVGRIDVFYLYRVQSHFNISTLGPLTMIQLFGGVPVVVSRQLLPKLVHFGRI